MKKSKILIVDDEASGRDTLAALLYERGYILSYAANGQDALNKAVEIKPDLILLDVMMPGMDGYEVCRRFRKDPLLSDVPVVMLTALFDRESRLKGIDAGADDFITKPYDIAELRTRVKNITRLNRYRRLVSEREKFEWVVDRARDGYLLVNDEDKIIYSNSMGKSYLGIQGDCEYPLLEPFIEIAKKQYRLEPEEAWQIWPEIVESKLKCLRYLLRPETEHSDAFWLSVNLVEMSAGSSSEYLIRLIDVTQEVLSRTNTWSFHSMVAHKLRTPIASLDAILELLKFDPNILSVEELKEFMADAHIAASRIKNQVEDILKSLGSKEKILPGKGHCSLNQINYFLDEIKENLNLKDLSVTSELIPHKEEIYISFSREAMEMVLRELLINSKKFHPEKDPSIEITIKPVSNGINISVCDNGVLLSPEQLSRMWLPYYQAERYFTGEVPGMGLGLWTIASMIWSSGGSCHSYNRQDGQPGLIVDLFFPKRVQEVL